MQGIIYHQSFLIVRGIVITNETAMIATRTANNTVYILNHRIPSVLSSTITSPYRPVSGTSSLILLPVHLLMNAFIFCGTYT